MPIDHYVAQRGVGYQDTCPRPAPRCYSRRPMSNVIRQSRVGTENNAVLVALSIITCVVAFLVVYGGGSF